MMYLDLVRLEFTGRHEGDDGLMHYVKLGRLEDFVLHRGVYTACRAIIAHVRQYNHLAPTTCLWCLHNANIPFACTTEEAEWSP